MRTANSSDDADEEKVALVLLTRDIRVRKTGQESNSPVKRERKRGERKRGHRTLTPGNRDGE